MWEKTVMSDDEIKSRQMAGNPWELWRLRKVAQAQAEISFKAGFDEGKEDSDSWHWLGDGEDHLENLMCPVLIEANDLRVLIAGAKQVGIREVVEWLMTNLRTSYFGSNRDCPSEGVSSIRYLQEEEWQAQKKEWGIDETS